MCLFTKKAWREKGTKGKLNFSNMPTNFPQSHYEVYDLPCGRCIECLNRYSNEWALRCAIEQQHSDRTCFITLTYSDAPNSVSKRDFQLFLKRLRRRLEPTLIRYFGCGEYGEINGRPHYHLLIFGWSPDDLYFWKHSKKGKKIYRSPFLESVWTAGFSVVEEANFNTAKYTAIYMQKMIYDDNREPAFVLMSKGLGRDAISSDLLISGKVYYDGYGYSVPRYFIRQLEKTHDVTSYKLRKYRLAKLYNAYMSIDDNLSKQIEFGKTIEKKQQIFKKLLTTVKSCDI